MSNEPEEIIEESEAPEFDVSNYMKKRAAARSQDPAAIAEYEKQKAEKKRLRDLLSSVPDESIIISSEEDKIVTRDDLQSTQKTFQKPIDKDEVTK